ncbi:MAG: ABC transporter ATP-binding protein [Fastidiosipilaceae bacterium]|jgi:ABC-2 type transport system ATP-binding protein
MILRTHDLSKQYGAFHALNKVSLSVRQNDIYGLIGRNGAGKSTLFKCVTGLATPDGGEIEINGETQNLNAARHDMGFMLTASFFPYLNAQENLGYLCRVKGVSGRAHAKKRVTRLLKMVGLDGVKKPFSQYSLGMKQRLGIAGALLSEPSFVVLDEPTNGLDPQGIIDIRKLIKDVHEETGTSFLISSHILTELDQLATRFGFIEQGVLLREISHEDLHQQTQKALIIEVDDVERTRRILGTAGVEIAAIDGNRLTLSNLPDRSGEPARMLVGGGVSLYELYRQETTLEDYFMRLIGGVRHD